MSIENIKKALGKVYPGEWYISRVKSNGLSVVENESDSSMFGITAERFEAEYIVAVNPAVISELFSTFSTAIEDVMAERKRQVEVEGWTPEHDDKHTDGALAKAATCYATVYGLGASYWPWDIKWWKPKGRRRDLIRAAALIIAEIERLDRLSTPHNPEGERG